MTDLLHVLPNSNATSINGFLPALERALVTTNDILTVDPLGIAKRAGVDLSYVRELRDELVSELQAQVGQRLKCGVALGPKPGSYISTLDHELDDVLGGGFGAGYLSEVTGER